MPKKSAQKKSGKKKQTKLAIIVLLIIIFVLLLGQTVRLIDSVFQPITNYPASSHRNYTWKGGTNLNLVIKSDTISVLSFDPFEKSITLVVIPPQTYVEVPGDYGSWQVRSIYDLGQSGKEPKGEKLLIDSMSSLLGLPINGIIEIKSNSITPYAFIASLKSNPLTIFSYFGNIRSNLTKAEFVSFLFNISQIRFDKISELKLEDFNLLSSKTISDGSKVLVAEPLLLDNFIIDKLSESKIKEEQISIAVFNGTRSPGLASKVARMITNMGGNVIISTNASFLDSPELADLEKSFITSNLGNNSYTVNRLKDIFVLDCPDNPNCDKMYTDKITSRAQVNVVVGRDFVYR